MHLLQVFAVCAQGISQGRSPPAAGSPTAASVDDQCDKPNQGMETTLNRLCEGLFSTSQQLATATGVPDRAPRDDVLDPAVQEVVHHNLTVDYLAPYERQGSA
jgi:hypothetical protein